MKKEYKPAELEIIQFDKLDVIVTSMPGQEVTIPEEENGNG